MSSLALKMLFGDRTKYMMLISGVVFATLLMTQGMALLAGIMSWMCSTLRNVRAEVWVADPRVEQIADNKPLRETDVFRVRSVDGVEWAVPLYSGGNTVKLFNGASKPVTLIGVDATTLVGSPVSMLHGSLDDLRVPDGVIIDEYGSKLFGESIGRQLKIGDEFELNDRRAQVVGICEAHRSFTGGPYLFTTYDRAVLYAPPQRKMTSYILVGARENVDLQALANSISSKTGLRALTEKEFMWTTIRWYIKNTGIIINVGTIVLIGFVVGTVISGQTFYSFIVENTRNFGAMKAMGLSNTRLAGMMILQSLVVGLIGFGIGQGIVATLGNILLLAEKVPFLLLWPIPIAVFVPITLICLFSASLGIWRISKLEPAIVFRT